MQQLNKVSTLETVAFVRIAHIQSAMFAISKLDVFFSGAICSAENKRSFKVLISFSM